MWLLVTDFNDFESVSTVMNQTHFQVAMFTFDTVLLYDDCYYIIQGISYCRNYQQDILSANYRHIVYEIIIGKFQLIAANVT